MEIYHRHHIIPKHMGGTNDPNNLIKLTIVDHAAWHYELWCYYGFKEDYMAWKGLSKQLGKEEIRRFLVNASNTKLVKNGTHHFLSGDIQRNQTANGKNALVGGKIQRKNNKEWLESGTHHLLGGKHAKQRVQDGTHHLLGGLIQKQCLEKGTFQSQKEYICPYCNKIGKGNGMFRHHFDKCKFKKNDTILSIS